MSCTLELLECTSRAVIVCKALWRLALQHNSVSSRNSCKAWTKAYLVPYSDSGLDLQPSQQFTDYLELVIRIGRYYPVYSPFCCCFEWFRR